MNDLATWLLEQIAEDEHLARDQAAHMPFAHATGAMSTLFSPERVLVECESKRTIVVQGSQVAGDDADARAFHDRLLRFMAAPYADRPGYREEWRP